MKILILAGGNGTRLWPMTSPPKQYALQDGNLSLLQKTILRFLKGYETKDLVILTQKNQMPLARKQADEVASGIHILAEAEPQNTAPALLHALDEIDDDLFLVAPSDHIIAPEDRFLRALETAKLESRDASAILFGIVPTNPNTQYGYIQCSPGRELSNVEAFIEKPPLENAMAYLESKRFLWNSGMLLFHREPFMDELQKHPAFSYSGLSIDHAFLESFENLKVLPLHLSWSDVGSWEGIYNAYGKDENGNVVIGAAELVDTKNSLVISKSRPVKVSGLDGVIAIESSEGVYMAHRTASVENIPVEKLLSSLF